MTGRLEQFIKNQGFSVRAFEISIGASDGMIRRAIIQIYKANGYPLYRIIIRI